MIVHAPNVTTLNENNNIHKEVHWYKRKLREAASNYMIGGRKSIVSSIKYKSPRSVFSQNIVFYTE